MNMLKVSSSIVLAVLVAGCATTSADTAADGMTFFVASVGKGNGAALGGLAGADAHCAALAKAAGSKQPTGQRI
jgi:hypothetical protein